jgi:hypothetical protein
MANLIQIKRSLNTATPASLANGEMAYTANGDVLFVGSNSQVVAVGGKRVPGTLTANQAVVVDSNSIINRMIVGSTTANIVANSTGLHLANTDGEGNTITITTPNNTEKGGNYYLKADGSWSTVTGATADPAGSNTHVQYNDSAVMGGSAGFTFKEDSNTLFIGNTFILGGGTTNASVNTTTIIIQSNSTHFASLTEGTLRLSNTVSNTQITVPTTTERSGSYFLKADGTWALVSANPGGADTQVLFNDGGSVSNGTAGFTFTKASNNVTVANAISAAIHSTSGWAGNTTALNPTANTILLGNTIGRWVITANSVATQGFAGNATAFSPTANTILLGNTIGRWVISANSVDATGNITTTGNVNAAIGYFTSSVNATTFTTTGNANAGSGFFTGTVNAANFTTTGNANAAVHYAGANVYANATTMYVGNSIANTITSNSGFVSTGNTTTLSTLTVNNQGVVVGNSTTTATVLNVNLQNTTSVSSLTGLQLLVGNSTLTGTNYRVGVQNSTSIANLTPIGLAVGTTVVNTSQITVAGGPTINATTLSVTDIIVSGNLDINGTVTTVDTTNMSVTDGLIQLARGNAGTTLDIGWVGNYNDGSARYAGVYWDQSNTAFELFANTTVDLTSATTIDPAGANSVRAKLNAYFRSGFGTGLFEANSTGVTITANSTYAVALTANSLSLTTQLPTGSGGTGQTTYAEGDLLIGTAGASLAKLTRGADGKVLVSTSSTIAWADLDGGTF